MPKSTADPDSGCEKVVIHLENRIIKGFLETHAGNTLDGLLEDTTAAAPAVLRIRPLGEEGIQDIPIQSTKAVFFVKDFNGDPNHKSLRFFRGAAIVHGVWIRVEFKDGEIMEGLVHNTIHFLVDPGFFMRPTDPYSNNRLVYVVKSWLAECRVLGLRNT